MGINSNQDNIFEAEFIKCISEITELDEKTVGIERDTRLIDDLMLDSLQLIRLITEIEEKYRIHIDIVDLFNANMLTVGELMKKVYDNKENNRL